MLTLRRGRRGQTVALVRVDDHLCAALSERAGLWNDLDDVRVASKDSAGCDNDGRSPQARLAADGRAEIQFSSTTSPGVSIQPRSLFVAQGDPEVTRHGILPQRSDRLADGLAIVSWRSAASRVTLACVSRPIRIVVVSDLAPSSPV